MASVIEEPASASKAERDCATAVQVYHDLISSFE